MKIKEIKLPEESITNKHLISYEYVDCFAGRFQSDKSIRVDQFAANLFPIKIPWINFLFRFRNILVRFVGLKTGDKIPPKESDEKIYKVGEKVSVWTISERNDNEIVMSESDKHLNFKASLLLRKTGDNYSITFITLVHLKNRLGSIYFAIVKPFHKLVVKAIIKSMIDTSVIKGIKGRKI